MREQSSWGNETNPFCCDRCWQGSPRPGSPVQENSTKTPTATDDPIQDNANTGRGNDAYNTSLERLASAEDAEDAQSPPSAIVGTRGSRLRNGDDAGASYGGTAMSWPSPSENAGGKNCPTPGLLPPVSTPGSIEEDTPATGPVRCGRGAVGLMPTPAREVESLLLKTEETAKPSAAVVPGFGRRGSSRVGVKPAAKPDAVAAAFSAHLHGVDKYPLELARLCRFAQFLTENELLREAYEVRRGTGGDRPCASVCFCVKTICHALCFMDHSAEWPSHLFPPWSPPPLSAVTMEYGVQVALSLRQMHRENDRFSHGSFFHHTVRALLGCSH